MGISHTKMNISCYHQCLKDYKKNPLLIYVLDDLRNIIPVAPANLTALYITV